MTYKQLRQTLKDGKKLRAFPLVDNPESMILLGSIQRGELIACIGKKRKKRKEKCLHSNLDITNFDIVNFAI